MALGTFLGRRPRETEAGEAWRVETCEVCGAGAVLLRRINGRPVHAHQMDGRGFTGLHCLRAQRGDMSILQVLDSCEGLDRGERHQVMLARIHGRAVPHRYQAAVYRELLRIAPSLDARARAAAESFRFPPPETFDRLEDFLAFDRTTQQLKRSQPKP